jgi:predicted HicB family RNase H-like nuclease
MSIAETTRLPHRVRRVIRRRSERAAQRIYGPQLKQARQGVRLVKRQYRGQRRQINRAYHRDVRSTRQAVSGFQKIIGAEARKTKSGAFGLTGRYKQEVAQELSTRGADVAQSLPTLTAEARQTRATALQQMRQSRASDISSALSDVQTAQADIAKKSAEEFLSETKSARLHRASNIKSRGQSGVAKGDLQKAVKVGSLMLETTPASKLPWGVKSVKHFGTVDNAWASFTRELLAQDAVTDPRVAIAAAKVLQRRYALKGAGAIALGQASIP